MIQNSFTSSSQFSASLSYCPQRRLTQALVHGLSKQEQITLVEKLEAHRNDIGLPMLLPALLLTFRIDSATRKVRDCHAEIVQIEHKTGIRTKWHADKLCCSGDSESQILTLKRCETIDFDQITANLTSLISKLAYVEYLCEVHLPMLDHFDAIHSRAVDSIADQSMKARTQQVEARLKTKLNFFRSSLKGTLVRAKYLSKRGQGQVQTVRNHYDRNLFSQVLSVSLNIYRHTA